MTAKPATKPVVCLSHVEGDVVISQVWAALLAKNKLVPTLFRFAGQLATLREDEHGNRVIALADLARVRGEVMRVAKFTKKIKASKTPTVDGFAEVVVPSPENYIIEDMIALPHEAIPALAQVVYAPIYSADGYLLAEGGYLAKSKAWRANFTPLATLNGDPRAVLDDWLHDFPFATQSDKTHAIALALLPLVRDMIDGPTPIHLIEANDTEAGKSLLAEVILTVATGRPPPGRVLPADEEARRKVISTALFGGARVVWFDNLKGKLEGASLEAAITAPHWADRIMGQTQELSVPVRVTWVMTANNATMSQDMLQRTVRIRLVRTSPFDEKTARHARIRPWTRDNQARLHAALVELVERWRRGGSKRLPTAVPRWEAWGDVIGGILHANGYAGFMLKDEAWRDRADPAGAEWRALAEAWWHRYRTTATKPLDIVRLATEANLLSHMVGDDRKSDQAKASAMGHALGKRADQRLGAFVLRALPKGGYHLEQGV